MKASRAVWFVLAAGIAALGCGGGDPGKVEQLPDGARCARDGQCSSGRCLEEVCIAPRALGEACAQAGECASRACECFDASCVSKKCRSSFCGRCEIAASDSSCGAGLGAPEPVADPNPGDGCSGDEVACASGVCLKRVGQPCTAAVECTSGLCQGTCKVAVGHACTANDQCGAATVCRGGACGAASSLRGPCDAVDGNADCQPGLTCALGTCRYPVATPAVHPACTLDADCVSGACEQGVCCAGECTGTCRSCAVPAHEGTCSPGPAGAACDDGDACTGGDACDAAGACAGCTCDPYCVGATWMASCPSAPSFYANFTCTVAGPASCEATFDYCE